MECSEYQDLKVVAEGDYPTPEIIRAVRWHEAICVNCGGRMPDDQSLRAIFKDMFARVGHEEVCQDSSCDHKKCPVSAFEREVVKQFKK